MHFRTLLCKKCNGPQGKHNQNDAFVTNVCPWTHSTNVVHWLQTVNLMRAGLAMHWGANMVRRTPTESKSWHRNFRFSSTHSANNVTLFLLKIHMINENGGLLVQLLWIDLPVVLVTGIPACMSSQASDYLQHPAAIMNMHCLLV